jgi:hypothetical protein
LIVNFPGSKKAVVECFQAIQSILPHAIEVIIDAKSKNVATHKELQKDFKFPTPVSTEKVLGKPFATSTIIDQSMSSRASEISDISDLLDKSSTEMEEVN